MGSPDQATVRCARALVRLAVLGLCMAPLQHGPAHADDASLFQPWPFSPRAAPDGGVEASPDAHENGPSADDDAGASQAPEPVTWVVRADDGDDGGEDDGGDATAPAIADPAAVPDDTTPTASAADSPATPPATHGDAAGPSLSTSDAIKAILGLLVLFALAYLGGHPAVRRYEKRLGVAQLVTAGFPFVLLGLLGRSEGVLSPAVLQSIGPLLPLGLGWIGFAIGFRFDVRVFDALPRALMEAFLTLTLVPFVAMIGAAAAMLALTEGTSADAAFVRDALVLATAGVVTARSLTGLLTARGAEATNIERIQRLIQLEELAAFGALILLAAFFRPENGGPQAGWVLPAVGWIFVTIGVGATLGVLIFAALRTIRGENETTAVMLGSIILAAGAASTLRLSPLVVCFLAGTLLANFHGGWKDQVRTTIARLERPIYLLFLVLAGALWQPDVWEAWVLLLLFVVARLLSRHLAVRLFARRHPTAMTPIERRHLAASPMGALAIAIVISAQELFAGPTVPWIVHAIIGGSLVSELAVRLFGRAPMPTHAGEPRPEPAIALAAPQPPVLPEPPPVLPEPPAPPAPPEEATP